MAELGIPELSTEQIELLSSNAEETAKKYVLSKLSAKDLDRLDIAVEVDGSKPVKVTVEIDLLLTKQAKGVDAEALVKAAVQEAHKATENFLRKLK
ncbi:MAG TPA: DUF3194 domain-containing protein [Candidatus Deferrimicrobiaceae bacterium]|nr:DUF3194 domain-containing protein [Candidatus Deferrimicrobiaceae bacterium]